MNDIQRLEQRQKREMQLAQLRARHALQPGMDPAEQTRRQNQLLKEENDLTRGWQEADMAADLAQNRAAQKANEDKFQARVDDITRRSQEKARAERAAREGRS